MRIRESLPFDQPFPRVWKHVDTLAANAARTEFYLRAGRSGGVRYLACTQAGGSWAWADWLHATTAVRLDDALELQRDLRRAADTAEITQLLVPGEVPGFKADGGYARHRDGWVTYGERVLTIPAPTWAPQARAYDIREGIYLAFPPDDDEGESYRLVRRRDYYHQTILHLAQPIARQGDMLVFADILDSSDSSVLSSVAVGEVVADRAYSLDRHELVCSGGIVVARHPEHPELQLPGSAVSVALAPGTSRPFARGAGRD